MRDMGVRSVPVVDDNRKLLGMVGLKDIARYYMDSVGFNDVTEIRSTSISWSRPLTAML